MAACATSLIVIATILGPVTLVFMSVSFGTNFWLEFKVNSAAFNTTIRQKTRTNFEFARYHLSRDRGLFRECYPGNDTELFQLRLWRTIYYITSCTIWFGTDSLVYLLLGCHLKLMCSQLTSRRQFRIQDHLRPTSETVLDLDEAKKELIDGYCFNVDYDLPSKVKNPSKSYMARLHLSRSFLAFFIIAITLYVVAYIFGLILCCLRASKWAYVAGIIAYASAFFLAAAIAFFHGAEYIERNKLNGGPNSNDAEFFQSWPQYLKDATTREYGWSYPLAWVGMILATIAGTFYSLAGCYIASELYEDEEVLHKSRPRDYPGPREPVYAIGADPYYTKHYGYPRAYLGPLAPEYYARTYPAIGYGDPRSDIWHWREIES